MTRPYPLRFRVLLSLFTLILCALPAMAQQPGGRVVLVLPFDNRSGQTNLGWIGESFPDTLDQRLTSAGFLTINRDDRQFALDHLGLPVDFRPSRATTIQIAQTLDADFVVVGSYTVDNGRISAQAQVLEVNKLRMSEPIAESSELSHLFDIENAIAWKIAKRIDPQFNVAEQTFLAASNGIPLSAFENYIRGITASNPQEKIRQLTLAVASVPSYPAAQLALGKAQYGQRMYDQAAATLGKIPDNDPRALEAHFFIGLARFNTAKYADAETAFAFVSNRLPLPEVVNNQAVASSRQGHDAVPLFQRASKADPNDAEYHYNLAVALYRRKDYAEAQREVDQSLKLRPKDEEAAELKAHLADGGVKTVAATSATPGATTNGPGSFDPVERIRRTYSEASVRQAAFQMDQLRAMRMTSLSRADQSAQYTTLGQEYMGQGLIAEAEREFQSAITADSSNAAAYAGMAQVRERSGNTAEARSQAQISLNKHPNVAAYLVLARLDFAANELGSAASNVHNALLLEPKNAAAQGMKQALISRGQAMP